MELAQLPSTIKNAKDAGNKSKAQEAKRKPPSAQREKMELAQLPPPAKKTPVKDASSKSKAADQSKSTEAEPSFFYTLQVGAYQTKAFAENMIRGLAGKGYNTFMSMLENGNTTTYKVQVERFDDAEKALVFSKEL